jgi:hypothetical protein
MSTSAFPVLSWAADDPKRWHDISAMTGDVEGGRAAREAWRHRIRQPMNQYRLKPAPK